MNNWYETTCEIIAGVTVIVFVVYFIMTGEGGSY